VLSDPQKRSNYDRFGTSGFQQGSFDPFHIFEQFFGNDPFGRGFRTSGPRDPWNGGFFSNIFEPYGFQSSFGGPGSGGFGSGFGGPGFSNFQSFGDFGGGGFGGFTSTSTSVTTGPGGVRVTKTTVVKNGQQTETVTKEKNGQVIEKIVDGVPVDFRLEGGASH